MSYADPMLVRAGWRRPALIAALCALVGALTVTLVAPADADARKRNRGPVFKAMTYNVAIGTGLSARNASTLDELCDLAGLNVREVDASKPNVRMKAVAEHILDKKPDLVGLQEADLLLTQTPADHGPFLGGTNATTVRYDFVQLILNRLNRGKRRYKLLDQQHEFEFEVKANVDGVGSGCDDSEIDARLITQNALLKRVGAGVRTSNVQESSYRYQLNLDLLGLPILIPRGWESVDARVRGSRKFRFVNTHLEAFDNHPTDNAMWDTVTDTNTPGVDNAVIRATQADELVEGPANASLPVVLLGDLNSNVPGVQPGDHLAFQRVLDAGFKRRSPQRPPSCCTDVILGPFSDFDHVVDHIMGKPGRKIRRLSSSVGGRAPVNGLFPSDHAYVFSALRIRR